MNADDWGAVSTWTDTDELARRLDAAEAHIAAWKAREQAQAARNKVIGTRIALTVAAVVWGFVGWAGWWAFQ